MLQMQALVEHLYEEGSGKLTTSSPSNLPLCESLIATSSTAQSADPPRVVPEFDIDGFSNCRMSGTYGVYVASGGSLLGGELFLPVCVSLSVLLYFSLVWYIIIYYFAAEHNSLIYRTP